MSTDITISFRVPREAFKVLKLIRSQNTAVSFELDVEDRSITIISDLMDFPCYSDDWDSADDFAEYFEEVE